ncbi:MAG TPA: hypothetical protein VFC73_07605 [Syntrophomonadaceae bacterium]|nr:hypothetical protein [Syntrophomonadaceae bacterium]
MSSLAKEIIERLKKEQDIQILAEVLNFYEYLKQKKEEELNKDWEAIAEDEPTDEERLIFDEYKNIKEDLTPLNDLVKELNLDGK